MAFQILTNASSLNGKAVILDVLDIVLAEAGVIMDINKWIWSDCGFVLYEPVAEPMEWPTNGPLDTPLDELPI